ncbi:F5/8 type C domain-containing protein [Streptomyces sp. DvalAA-14]|uniref:IS701 family transposase n=1 Tax=unclassified Streptomyces TaxID=2593676 RepID=UPI00081B88ED|nr:MULTISPECIES: IS701 family transposase [unclassified Streptomyces]MYS24002.1 IS701 family transposase [Streptomyces sp. SID4948]SCE41424.1 F5/8 type C domain-containing protein [Streptomyces sp. DvalAA-14]
MLLRVGERVGRVEPRRHMRDYVRGLLGPVGRKNSWQIAEHAGHGSPYGLQRLLSWCQWEPDEIRDDLREYVAERLGQPDGVVIVDDTGFLKKGTVSAGVQRQYSGTAGRTENCQIGVFAAYASDKGRALVDRELYLPKSWTEDPDRCRAARIPTDGDTSTWAQATGQYRWISQVDPGAQRSVNLITLLKPDDKFAAQFHVDSSADGSSWYTVARHGGSAGGLIAVQLDHPTKARYLRVIVHRPDQ